MSCNNYWKAKIILEKNKHRWLKLNPDLPNCAGIYILTRVDETGMKFAYIGQAKHILDRLAQHLTQYQHIDLSLKKHGLYSQSKPYGWQVDYFICLENELDGYEREYVVKYANLGYQLRNKTAGGQDKGKIGIDEQKASKGYHDGLKQGYTNCLKDVRVYFDKYLSFSIKDNNSRKKNGEYKKIFLKKFDEFEALLKKGTEPDGTEQDLLG